MTMAIEIKSRAYVPVADHVPRNCGYMINGRKVKGSLNKVILSGQEVYVDPDTREIHVFTRRGYQRWMLADGESVDSAFTVLSAVRRGRMFCTSRAKVVCPDEEKNGVCRSIDRDHRRHHYHFASGRFDSGGKPICRYSRTDEGNLCWERYSARHCKVFAHK